MSTPLMLVTPLRVEAICARRGAPRARVVRTGMGRERSLAAAGRLRPMVAVPGARPAPRVVVLGLAGGLQVGQRAGDVVVADRLSLAPLEAGSAGVGAVAGALDLPVVEGIAAALSGAGLTFSRGTVVSTSRLQHGTATRAVMAGAGGIAVDMESWWLATGLPVAAVVRVLSDVPGQELVSARTPAALLRAFRALVGAARAVEAWAERDGGEVSSRMEVQS